MKRIREGIARLYAADRDGRVIMSFMAYLADSELREITEELKRLSLRGFLGSYQAAFLRGEPIADRLIPDGEQVLRYVGGLAEALGAAQGGVRPRSPWLGGSTGPDGQSFPEDWDPRSETDYAIANYFARTIFALSWADAAEEEGISLSQVRLMEEAPETPAHVKRTAFAYLRKMSKANNKTIEQMYHQAIEKSGMEDTRESEEDFAYNIAMEALGHGINWEDDHEPHELEVPHFEFTHLDLYQKDLHFDEWEHRRVRGRNNDED